MCTPCPASTTATVSSSWLAGQVDLTAAVGAAALGRGHWAEAVAAWLCGGCDCRTAAAARVTLPSRCARPPRSLHLFGLPDRSPRVRVVGAVYCGAWAASGAAPAGLYAAWLQSGLQHGPACSSDGRGGTAACTHRCLPAGRGGAPAAHHGAGGCPQPALCAAQVRGGFSLFDCCCLLAKAGELLWPYCPAPARPACSRLAGGAHA